MSQPFIAEIIMFGGSFAPRGWALCDGQLLPINQNQSLFSLLGTTYGGDGRTTFGLPELRGRVAVHEGNGPGLPNVNLGQKGGSPTHTLTTGQIPAHTHAVAPKCNTDDGTGNDPEGNFPGASGAALIYGAAGDSEFMGSTDSSTVGGNQSFDQHMPYNTVNFIIALTGVYPSRN